MQFVAVQSTCCQMCPAQVNAEGGLFKQSICSFVRVSVI